MEKQKMLKVAGLVTTALGFAVTLVAVKKAMENGGK